jgi:serine/threonine protein kinase
MKGMQSEYDFLNLSQNHAVKSNITRDEEIQFTDKINKKDNYFWAQERNIIITNKAIYNLKKFQLKRRIDIKALIGITISKNSDEFVLHCKDLDYDYHFSSPRRKIILDILSNNYKAIFSQELKLFELPEKNLKEYVTTKEEKEKQNTYTRMPKNANTLNIKDYLFGNQSKTEINKNQSNIKQKHKFQNIKVNYNDFEIIKVIGRGYIGKILLVKYKNDGKYYAMKMMRKDQIISEELQENILLEKNILIEAQCEFILSLSFFFQTNERIYYLTPFIKGGDLYHKLKTDKFFKEDLVKFYSAQIAVALQYLHDLGIVYRDLKPENILLNDDGYIKLCDFGAAIKLHGVEKNYNFAGSPEYASPEMINYLGHTVMTDWWSFGILIYEMLYGFTPFFNLDKDRMYDLIINGSISFPQYFNSNNENGEKIIEYKVSDEAKNLINKLLEKDPGKRLGREGFEEIKKVPFFYGINFDGLKNKKHKALFIPNINENDLTNNFEEEYLNLDIEESPVGNWIENNEYNTIFQNFETKEEKDEFEVLDPIELAI